MDLINCQLKRMSALSKRDAVPLTANEKHVLTDEDEFINYTAQEKRRQRNKLLAKRNRLKSKQELSESKLRLKMLLTENKQLNRLINKKGFLKPKSAAEILAQDISLDAGIFAALQNVTNNFQKEAVFKVNVSFCLINRMSKGGVVVYVSPRFTELTGYSMFDAIAKCYNYGSCDFSDPLQLDQFSIAIAQGQNGTFNGIYHRRKNSEPFWCYLQVAPLAVTGCDCFSVVIQHSNISGEMLPRSDSLGILRDILQDSSADAVPIMSSTSQNSNIDHQDQHFKDMQFQNLSFSRNSTTSLPLFPLLNRANLFSLAANSAVPAEFRPVPRVAVHTIDEYSIVTDEIAAHNMEPLPSSNGPNHSNVRDNDILSVDGDSTFSDDSVVGMSFDF